MLPLIALLITASPDLTTWEKSDEKLGVVFNDGQLSMTSDKWGFLRSPVNDGPQKNEKFDLTFTIREAAKQFNYFGETWSVWPDATVPDLGYEFGVVARMSRHSGYRIQFSHKYQTVALVKYPDGGYVCAASCALKLNTPHRVEISLSGKYVGVQVDGHRVMWFRDEFPTLEEGMVGIGTSSGAKVTIDKFDISPAIDVYGPDKVPHIPKFNVRKWVGDRQWIFDGDEPIMLLMSGKEPYCQNVKLRPGYKPQLMWNAFWDIANQGAYKEGANTSTDPVVTGSGKSISAAWTTKHNEQRYLIETKLMVGYDSNRNSYTYDVDSELLVLSGLSFEFRYGFDFEHHTPLDPFQWQYLVVRKKGGQLLKRPVLPIDPGVIEDVESYRGQRVWYGRHNETMQVAPAVEYHIDPTENPPRKLNTAVCAAFYDTGVSFAQEIAKPGTKVRVKYRYTGYPAEEAKGLFDSSKVPDLPTLDPNHHYIFADQWPSITFTKFKTLSESWIGLTPFMSGHNQRPTYELVKDTHHNSGHAMKLGPNSYGAASMPLPRIPLQKGRWVISLYVKSDNPHGPGGRVELAAIEPKTGKVLREETYYLGNESFDWKFVMIATDLPSEASGIRLGLGNSGTGDVYIGEVNFRQSDDKVLDPQLTQTPPKLKPAPEGAIADYRFAEGKGNHVFNYAQSPLGILELANLDWVKDEGRVGVRFSDPKPERKQYPRLGVIERGYLSHPAYKDRQSLPFAIAGHHGGSFPLKAFTIAAWIKPDAKMGKSDHGGKGDIVGLGARRVILSLIGQEAPYKLNVRMNVNDSLTADSEIKAGQWAHVAVTGEPQADGHWRLRLFLDGKMIKEGSTEKFRGALELPPSLILGAEIFYLHDAFYRGLIGRVTVFDRALGEEQLKEIILR